MPGTIARVVFDGKSRAGVMENELGNQQLQAPQIRGAKKQEKSDLFAVFWL